MVQSPVETLVFNTADELLAALHPDRRYWNPGGRGRWLFRGQGDARWKLLPTAYRADVWKRFDGSELLEDHNARVDREAQYIRNFMNKADRSGLLVPDDHAIRSIRQFVDQSESLRPWPSPALRALAALAQHHRIPTRLLDWTWKPHVAAYFAAEHFLDDGPKPERGCIWAFKSNFAALEVAMPGHENRDERIVLVPAPQATNRNLSAQAGTFTLDLADEMMPLEDLVGTADVSKANDYAHRNRPLLFKFEFPADVAIPLLRLLDHDGINAATVFPGYDGVVRAMREEREWKKRFPWPATGAMPPGYVPVTNDDVE
jgi:hypothetical protein